VDASSSTHRAGRTRTVHFVYYSTFFLTNDAAWPLSSLQSSRLGRKEYPGREVRRRPDRSARCHWQFTTSPEHSRHDTGRSHPSDSGLYLHTDVYRRDLRPLVASSLPRGKAEGSSTTDGSNRRCRWCCRLSFTYLNVSSSSLDCS
jgi:hypothetical protein